MLLMLFQSGESKTVYCVPLHMFVFDMLRFLICKKKIKINKIQKKKKKCLFLCFWFFPLIPSLQLEWARIAIFVIHPQEVFLVVIYENQYPLS